MDLEQAYTDDRLAFSTLFACPPVVPRKFPGLPMASTYQALFAMARELGVSACAVIGLDLAALEQIFWRR